MVPSNESIIFNKTSTSKPLIILNERFFRHMAEIKSNILVISETSNAAEILRNLMFIFSHSSFVSLFFSDSAC